MPRVNLEAIDQRTAIRNAIHRGDIEAAIEQLNDLNSEVCFSFTSSRFSVSTMIQPLHAPLSESVLYHLF